MLAIMSLAVVQAASNAPLPVIKNPPASMLRAGYDQCLGREVTRRLAEPITPEEVFDRSQAECGFWLDAYITKLASESVSTHIDYEQEKAAFLEKVKVLNISYVRKKRGSLEAASASADSEKRGK